MNEPHGLLLCDDLIFTSRICGEAKALGLSLRPLKTAQDLLRFLVESGPNCVIVDLQTPGLVVDEVVQAGRNLTTNPTLVGYGSHVDTATLKKAREAGFDVVWPRSKFAEELASALPLWFKPKEASA